MIGLTAATLVAALAAPPRVEDAWSRPATSIGVVYAKVENPGNRPLRLVSASSPVAAHVQLHESTAMSGGTMHGMAMTAMAMHPVRAIVVPPHRTVGLQPGGYHIMLLGLRHPLRVGERFPVRLRFADGATVTAAVHVENRAM